MKGIGQLFVGLITALGTSLLVLAAASLAITEGGLSRLPTPAIPTPVVDTLPEQPQVPTTISLPTATQPQPTACPVPEGWEEYVVQIGDTMEGLAEQNQITPEELKEKNCWTSSSNPLPGTILYLPVVAPTNTPIPALPTAEPTFTVTVTPTLARPVVQCGHPLNWVAYIVRPGDTLFRLSLALNISVQQLMFANCLTSDRIYAGQILYVPFYPPVLPTYTRTPLPPTATVEVINTPIPSNTPAPPTPEPTIAQPSPEPSPIPTELPTVVPTAEATAASSGNIDMP